MERSVYLTFPYEGCFDNAVLSLTVKELDGVLWPGLEEVINISIDDLLNFNEIHYELFEKVSSEHKGIAIVAFKGSINKSLKLSHQVWNELYVRMAEYLFSKEFEIFPEPNTH